MTLHVTLDEAAGKLKELVARVRAGEEVLIDENGAAVARIAAPVQEEHWRAGQPIDQTRFPRGRGVLAHLGPVKDPDEALRPDPDLEAAWKASRVFPDGDE